MSADLNQLIQKVPKPILVVVVLAISIALFVFNDPLKDECQVQGDLLTKKLGGLFVSKTINRPIDGRYRNVKQFSQANYWKDRCRLGNSIGACNDYFEALRTLTNELKFVSEKCQLVFSEKNEIFSTFLIEGLRYMALAAWGEKPPEGAGARLGWLTQAHLQTFCGLQRSLNAVAEEGTLDKLIESVYLEYPDSWPESVPPEERIEENRPRALRTESNPKGSFKWKEVHERSLFSFKCNNYM